eukprot:427403_1
MHRYISSIVISQCVVFNARHHSGIMAQLLTFALVFTIWLPHTVCDHAPFDLAGPTCSADSDCESSGICLNYEGAATSHGEAGKFFCEEPCSTSAYRPANGVCTNSLPGHKYFGAKDHHQTRLVNARTPQTRPSPRSVTDKLCKKPNPSFETPNAHGNSLLLIITGQFIDHDTTLIEVSEKTTTMKGSGSVPDFQFNSSRGGIGKRNPTFPNLVTSFMDLSTVYGSDLARQRKLRLHRHGLMRFQRINGEEFLPFNSELPEPVEMAMGNLPNTFAAGDPRANEQPGLTAMHVLFLREHNRLAREIIRKSRRVLSDEHIFQIARRYNIAQWQHIVFDEYFPELHGVKMSPYTGYNPAISPDTTMFFSTCSHRSVGDAFKSKQCCMVLGAVQNDVICVRDNGAFVKRELPYCDRKALISSGNAFYPGTKDELGRKINCDCSIGMRW